MNHLLSQTQTPVIDEQFRRKIDRLINFDAPRYRRLWAYYRNPMLPVLSSGEAHGSERPYRQAQEWGLPSRITGSVTSSLNLESVQPVEGVARKEVVIENDIGWRIDTMIDYLFGKPIVIHSQASEPVRREQIESLVKAILEHNGGITFLQQLALMGAVYGFVDVLVKLLPEQRAQKVTFDPATDGAPPSTGSDCSVGSHTPPAESAPVAAATPSATDASHRSRFDDAVGPGAGQSPLDAHLQCIARRIRLEIVEPARALPLLSPIDYRIVEAYVQVYEVPGKQSAPIGVAAKRNLLHRILDRFAATRSGVLFSDDAQTLIVEILTPHHWQRYANDKLVANGSNSLGEIPLVHVQNLAIPFEYAGMSDVEMLVPLQDELNTRLCDRAHRITLQSFRMYLGKGIEGFTDLPVAPGRMWMTDNERAEVIEFGGDASSPSEDRHISELREAMDKTSSVTPIAAGAIKGRIGRLTSAAALRVTMLALLAKTERKRTTYGEAITRMMELSLAWLDRAGLFRTSPDERHFEIHWPNPLPANDIERLHEARLKQQLGIPPDVVRRELGY